MVRVMSSSAKTRAAKEQGKKTAATESSSSSASSDASEGESDSNSEVNSELADGGKVINAANVVVRACDHCKKVKPNIIRFKYWRYCSHKCYNSAVKEKKVVPTTTSRLVKKSSQASNNSTSPTSSTAISSSSSSPHEAASPKPDITGSFNWASYLKKSDFVAAPVSCFKHVALADSWSNIYVGLKVEIINTECESYAGVLPAFYWVASVMKVAGYMVLLRYIGYDDDDSQDKWMNMCTDEVHPVGWCSSKGIPLVHPKRVEEKYGDCKQLLAERLIGSHTIPQDFSFKAAECMNNNIQKGMRLEVVDKNRLSCVRVATVNEIVGGRLHVIYEGCEEEDEGFWCHERSPLIHPIGWAQVIGHDLRATPEYARQSLQKTLFREFEPNDATWDMFLPVLNPVTDLKFEVGMKLEAIDPLNLSTICVATVTRVLRNNYLMIGIDGMMAPNGADCFCYHASSPCIFPVGFCETNTIQLTPPRGHKGEFKWEDYLRLTKSSAAPVGLFKKVIPDHGFKEGMHLEAVDLMEPRLICVGSVKKVVGRLLCIHFDGWEEAYDQWCDCESPDLFPVGWCQVVGYRLEPPRSEPTDDFKKKRKMYKAKRRKKKMACHLKKLATSITRSGKDKSKDGAVTPDGTGKKSISSSDTSGEKENKN